MNIYLLVIRTAQLETLKKQYESLGFQFDYHQHGKGPLHYSSTSFNFVFEIYPLQKDQTTADKSTRLGFEVENLNALLVELEQHNWKINPIQTTDWGEIAVVEDLDGRRIELKEK